MNVLLSSYSLKISTLHYSKPNYSVIEIQNGGESSIPDFAAEEEEISCDRVSCIVKELNMKKSDWGKVFDKRVACLEELRTACSETTGMKREDADFVHIKDVVLDVEKQIVYVQSSDLEHMKSTFPYLSIQERSSTDETVEWPDTHPWLILLPPDPTRILSIVFLLLHSFLYPTSLPSKTELLFPSVDRESTVFPEGLFPLLIRTFDPSLKVKYQKDMREQFSMVHFNDLILMGSYHRNGVMQIVEHPFDSDYMRAAVYKEYGKELTMQGNRHCMGVYITKFPGASTELRINERAIAYASRKVHRMGLTTLELNSSDLSVVVKEMVKVDFILAVSGPSLSLAMFMLPQSGVMEILPKFQKEATFYQMAASLNLQHFAHYQLQKSAYELGEGDYEAFVDTTALWIYLQDLVNMVLHNKYHI